MTGNPLRGCFRITLRRTAGRLLGLLRLGLYLLAVSAVLSTLALRSAYADLKESGLVLGRQMLKFGDFSENAHRVRLNGEPVYVASTVSDDGVDAILNRFETACRERAGDLSEMFARLPESLRRGNGTSELKASALGIARQQTDSDGMVACLAQPSGQDVSTLIKRLHATIETGDLSHVGELRYVYARRLDGRKTHVVAVWTEGPFRIFSIAPPAGEPGGSDSSQVPRPDNAARLLSAEVDGAPHGVRIYVSPSSSDQVLRNYDTTMPKQGWSLIPLGDDRVPYGRAYSRDGVDVFIFAYEQDARTVVSMVETGSR